MAIALVSSECFPGLSPEEQSLQIYLALGGTDSECFLGLSPEEKREAIYTAAGGTECFFGRGKDEQEALLYAALYASAGDASLLDPACFYGLSREERAYRIYLASTPDPSCFLGLSPAEQGQALFNAIGGGSAVGPDYYFAAGGDDSAAGTQAEPLATRVKANTLNLQPGDRLLFNGGDTFYGEAFTPTDSGTSLNPIVVTSYGTGRAIHSGGVEVEGWEIFDAPNGIWRAPFSAALGRPRQIWVDGRLCRRAASSDIPTGTTADATGYDTSASSDPGWLSGYGNKADIEFVYQYWWTESRIQVADVAGNDITMAAAAYTIHKGFFDITPLGWPNEPTSIENAYEIFEANADDQTFYQDRTANFLYLIPPSYVDDPNDVTVIAGLREHVIELDGVSDLTFDNLEFAHTTESLPFSTNGFSNLYGPANNVEVYLTPAAQHVQACDVLGAAALVNNCDRIAFTGNLVHSISGIGIHIHSTSVGCSVEGNIFHETGANGVVIGKAGEVLTAAAPSTTTVKNNIFQVCGREYKGCSQGSFQFYASSTLLEHNLARYTPYTGLAKGWGWYTTTNTADINNIERLNEIHHTMARLTDGSCLYSNGWADNEVIEQNYLHHGGTGYGIYCDNGSSGKLVQDNVLHHIFSATLVGINDARGPVTVDDTFADNGVITDFSSPFPPTIEAPNIVGNSQALGEALGAGPEVAFATMLTEADNLLLALHDTFTAANGTAINGRTPSPLSRAGKWQLYTGASAQQTIQANKMQLDGSGATTQRVVIDGGPSRYPADYDYTATGTISIDTLAAGAGFGFLFAIDDATDTDDFFIAFFSASGASVYSSIVGVVAGPIAANAGAIPTAGVSYPFTIEQEGSLVTITLSIGPIAWDTSDTFGPPGTLSRVFGFQAYNGIVTVDDVQIKGFVD